MREQWQSAKFKRELVAYIASLCEQKKHSDGAGDLRVDIMAFERKEMLQVAFERKEVLQVDMLEITTFNFSHHIMRGCEQPRMPYRTTHYERTESMWDQPHLLQVRVSFCLTMPPSISRIVITTPFVSAEQLGFHTSVSASCTTKT
jgi:hypothetical protein